MKNGDDNVGKTEHLTEFKKNQSIYEYLKEKQSCFQMRIFWTQTVHKLYIIRKATWEKY